MPIDVAVLGAAGRMGAEVCRAVADAEDLVLAAAVDPGAAGRWLAGITGVECDVTVAGGPEELAAEDIQVAVDFTHPDAVAPNVTWLLEHGIHAVVGTTGIADADLERLRDLAAEGEANALFAPNFAVGAVLLMESCRRIATHLPDVEIIELHHDGKADAPSGTALRTADLIADARPETPDPVMGETHEGARGADRSGIRVHSVRLPGLVAHQEVIFGGPGQTLTVRHDSTDRTSFMPGVLLAVRAVGDLDGLVVGLEHLL